MSSQHTQHQATRRPGRTRALALLAAVSVLTLPTTFPAIGQTQSEEQGGLLLRLGITQELQTDSNPGLASPENPSQQQARTLLSFAAISQTPIDTLSLSVNGALEFGDNRDSGLADPTANLSWRREVANSALELSLGLRERDVEDIDFGLGLDSSGGLIVTSRAGTGTERQTSGNVSLELGRNSRFGTTFSLGRTDTEYQDTTSFEDQERTTASAALRFDLTTATTATLNLSTRQLDQSLSGRSDTDTLRFSLETERPDGRLSLSAQVDDTVNGTRETLTIGRSYALPSGALSGQIGAVRTTTGDVNLTAAVDWTYVLPRGTFTLGFDQTVTDNTDNVETDITALSIGLSQTLTPRLSADFGLTVNQRDTGASALDTTDITASLSYAMDENWSLGLSAEHRIREETGTPQAKSTIFGLSVSRTFEWRP